MEQAGLTRDGFMVVAFQMQALVISSVCNLHMLQAGRHCETEKHLSLLKMSAYSSLLCSVLQGL